MCRPGLRGVRQAEGMATLSGDGWQHMLWNRNRAGESLPAAQSRLAHLLSFHTELSLVNPKQTHFFLNFHNHSKNFSLVASYETCTSSVKLLDTKSWVSCRYLALSAVRRIVLGQFLARNTCKHFLVKWFRLSCTCKRETNTHVNVKPSGSLLLE